MCAVHGLPKKRKFHVIAVLGVKVTAVNGSGQAGGADGRVHLAVVPAVQLKVQSVFGHPLDLPVGDLRKSLVVVTHVGLVFMIR